jgi:serralysin
MPGINAEQLQEVTFLTGVDASGTVATNSFWTWAAAQEGAAFNYEAKWGAATIGTSGSVKVYFDPASHWTDVEQQSLTSSMDLWSAVANIKFVTTTNSDAADVTVSRGQDGFAQGGITSLFPGTTGTSHLGRADAGEISIDTSVQGFGPIDGTFSVGTSYTWMTMLHEWGHVIGLGHGGDYSDAHATTVTTNGPYDLRAWTIMSYADADNPTYWSSSTPLPGFYYGSTGSALTGFYSGEPTTWMPLDILSAQRLYGAATDSPLSGGGQVFGFHSNISGDIHDFFDFTVNTQPAITIWDGGTHNTLDVSGFQDNATVSLEPGTFSSVAGLDNNIAIAFGTHIETAIGGSGDDTIRGNDLSDVLMGGVGSDSLVGGAGNDHIYGNMLASVAGTTDGGDYIDVGGGTNYANGNGGNDTIVAGDGYNRLFGGQGDDHISAGNGPDSVNGNLGNDVITVGNGNNTVRGGQGDDIIHVGSGNDLMMGDLGNDKLYAGTGHDVMTGGSGGDLFLFLSGTGSMANGYDEITDFDAAGGDQIALTFSVGTHIVHQAGTSFASAALAADAAAALLSGQSNEVAALQVGSDTYLFFNNSGGTGVNAAIHLDHIDADSVNSTYFI